MADTLERAKIKPVPPPGDPVTRGMISDNKSGKIYADASTHALLTMDYEHHEIHEGDHYFIQAFVDLPINNVYDVQFTTPNTTTWSHLTFDLLVESETAWYIYEGPTINTAGTAFTPINNNRNSANTSGNTIKYILNVNSTGAEADTDTSGATLIASGSAGSGMRGSGVASRDNEIILKQNSDYCMRAVAVAAGYVSFNMQWYEHADKD